MFICKIVVILLFCYSISFSITTSQSDWSGGAGVTGPVEEFGTTFDNSSGISFSDYVLSLGNYIFPSPDEHLVCDYSEPRFSIAADVDEDGDLDILHSSYTFVSWMENLDGSGINWSEHIIDTLLIKPRITQFIDMNCDGDTDLFGTSNSGDEIVWWENVGSLTWIKHVIDEDYDNISSAYSCDIDGDGDIDVLGASNNQSNISWWENIDGSGLSMTKHSIDDGFIPWTVHSGDMDNDGDIDVVSASYFQSLICWWENSDTTPGLFITNHNVAFSDNNKNSFCADIDNDGDMDIVGGGYYQSHVSWQENIDGTGISWEEHKLTESYSLTSNSISASDVDDDGDVDVIGSSLTGACITWWENSNGEGDFWTEHTDISLSNGPARPFVADINGDNLNDLLATLLYDEETLWWEIFEPATEGFLESSIFDSGDFVGWEEFSSSTVVPVGTVIGFQFRSSNDSSNMGIWSDILFSPEFSFAVILADSTRYLQYKVILETADPEFSPELAEVTFTYTLPVGIGESGATEVPSWFLSISENPSYGSFSALASVPKTGLVKLSLYDITGRVIAQTSEELQTGTHSVNFTELAEGVYFCTMRAGSFFATERVVVLK